MRRSSLPQRQARGGTEKRLSAGPRVRRIPDFVEPQLGRWWSVLRGAGLGTRGQVRRLSLAATGRRRHGLAQNAQRARLDAEVLPVAAEAGVYPIVSSTAKWSRSMSSGYRALQHCRRRSRKTRPRIWFFLRSICCSRHTDLRALPMAERKARLEQLLDAHRRAIRYVHHLESRGDAVFGPLARWARRDRVEAPGAPYLGSRR